MNKFFFSPKKRAVIFALVVVLVMGFFVYKVDHANAALSNPPKPGTPYAQWPEEWRNAPGADKYKTTGAPATSSYNHIDYADFLENVGGYSHGDAANMSMQSNRIIPSPVDVASNIAGAVGGYIGEKINETAIKVVITVLTVIAGFCKMLLMYSGQALDMTLNPSLYTGIANNQMVVGGWIIVRDVCNLFFLLVLLFIAICTILKIDKYHAKKTLLTLIIMALLINFSKPIAIFIFDGSQLLMNMFLSEITKTGQGSPSAKLAADIAEFLYRDLMNHLAAQPNSWTIAIYYLFVVVFLFMFAVALFVMAIFMIIRIIAIMVLVIVSPLAFFAAIVPDFSKMASGWWSSLFKYSYYGPAAAFFLFLATKFAIANSNSTILPQINIPGGGGATETLVIQHIIRYLVVLVFLYASIIMANKFGIYAAAGITGNANRFMKWAGGMTKGGGMWGGAARVTGTADVYKGVKGGIAKQPVWRMLTKEGREAKSRERQERWEGRVAPFNIANAQKKAKELENVDIAKINTGIAKGDAASILEAARRGKLTDAQLASSSVRNLMNKSTDFEAATYKNLRSSGNGHLQYSDLLSRGKTTTEAFDATFKDMSVNLLSEQKQLDSALLTEQAAGGTDIFNKLNNISAMPVPQRERMVGPLLTRAQDPNTINVLNRVFQGLPPI